jgi:hypothetical protein
VINTAAFESGYSGNPVNPVVPIPVNPVVHILAVTVNPVVWLRTRFQGPDLDDMHITIRYCVV